MRERRHEVTIPKQQKHADTWPNYPLLQQQRICSQGKLCHRAAEVFDVFAVDHPKLCLPLTFRYNRPRRLDYQRKSKFCLWDTGEISRSTQDDLLGYLQSASSRDCEYSVFVRDGTELLARS